MRKAFFSSIVAASAALLALPALATGSQVSALHTLLKIRPEDDPPTEPVARIAGAANEMEGFQVVIRGGDSGLRNVTAHVTELVGPTTIDDSNFVLYRQEDMEVRERSAANAMPGRGPDARVPGHGPAVGGERNALPVD